MHMKKPITALKQLLSISRKSPKFFLLLLLTALAILLLISLESFINVLLRLEILRDFIFSLIVR